MSKKKKEKKKKVYPKNPKFWWEDEKIHKWFKGEKSKLSKKAKEMFDKKR